MATKQPASTVLDVGAVVAYTDAYQFLGVSGAVTAYIEFADYTTNNQPVTLRTISIPAANGTNVPARFSDVAGFATTWIGAVVRFSGAVYCAYNYTDTDDLKTNYANCPWIIPAGVPVPFGRVNPMTFSPAHSIVQALQNVVISPTAAAIATKSTYSTIANQNNGTAAVSGGTPVKALGSATPTAGRLGIVINNHSTSDGIWVYQSTDGTTPPSITSATNQIRIAPNTDRTFSANGSTPIYFWVLSESASNTCTFTAFELIA